MHFSMAGVRIFSKGWSQKLINLQAMGFAYRNKLNSTMNTR